MGQRIVAFIVRIDGEGTNQTHGWQVRGRGRRGYHSKLFSDVPCGGKAEALALAEAYLIEYVESHPEEQVHHPANVPFHQGALFKNNTSGVNGVYFTNKLHRWHKKRDPDRREQFWCAFVPIGPERQYFNKLYNVARYGLKDAYGLAVDFRQAWEVAVLAGDEALKVFFRDYHFLQVEPKFIGV